MGMSTTGPRETIATNMSACICMRACRGIAPRGRDRMIELIAAVMITFTLNMQVASSFPPLVFLVPDPPPLS